MFISNNLSNLFILKWTKKNYEKNKEKMEKEDTWKRYFTIYDSLYYKKYLNILHCWLPFGPCPH